MVRSIGIAGGAAVVLVGGLLLGAYQVQGETMPGWLFNLIVIAGVVILVLGGTAFLAGRVVVPILGYARLWSIRMPFVKRGSRDPNQGLLDIAKEHAENPAARLIILKAEFTDKNLTPDEFRPWVEIGLTIRNVGVHDILVGRAEGHAIHKGRELPVPIQGEAGKSGKPRDHQHVYKLKQYLPPSIAKDLYKEMCGDRHRVTSLGLSGIRIEVTSEGENGRQGWLSLGNVSFIEMPD